MYAKDMFKYICYVQYAQNNKVKHRDMYVHTCKNTHIDHTCLCLYAL